MTGQVGNEFVDPNSRGVEPGNDDQGGVAILDAAMRLLADGGLTAFTTDRLAAEASVSKSSIYRRWPDKKAIFLALMHQWASRAEVEDHGGLVPELDQWFADRQRVYNESGFRQVAASLVELSAHDPEIGEALGRYRRSTWNTLREILNRAVDRDEIADGFDVDHLEQFLLGPMYYRSVLEGLEVDDASVSAFRNLSLTALGFEVPS